MKAPTRIPARINDEELKTSTIIIRLFEKRGHDMDSAERILGSLISSLHETRKRFGQFGMETRPNQAS